MPHVVEVRRATAQDVGDIMHITKEAFEKYKLDLAGTAKVKALMETEQDVLQDIRHKTVLLALLNGEPVGSVRYEVLSPDIAYFGRFGVVLQAQSLGVGGVLVSEVVEQCKRQGIPALALHTSARMSSLIRFYYGKGFFVHSVKTDKGYYRALLIKELVANDQAIDYAAQIPSQY